jgi:molecular chaperone Hsp33
MVASDILGEMRVGDGPGVDDALLPFQVDRLDARGRVVRLGASVDRLLKRHAYPEPVARLVAEAAALTALLGSALKGDGRFQLHTKSDCPVGMLVVDFDAPARLRAYARFAAEAVAPDATSAALLGRGHLALTIEPGGGGNRYQGVVALDGAGLEAAAHQYFRQSEQIPTRIRLAVGQTADSAGLRWRAGGLFLQFLPAAPERMRQGDLDPGDAPEGAVADPFREDDAWAEAKALMETVEDHELLDPALSSERLLYRLFHEPGVRVFEGRPVVEACRCSQERILAMLRRFTDEERAHMTGDDGRIAVTCEFCSTRYTATPEEARPPA